MKLLLALLMITSLLFSCKKDKNDAKTKTTLLTEKGWFATTVLRRDNTTDPWEPNLFSTEPCVLDNKTTFTTDKNYSIDNGAIKCDVSEAQTLETGTWTFTTSETHLSFSRNLPGGVIQLQDWTISQLDENTFKFEYYYPTGPYYQVTMTH